MSSEWVAAVAESIGAFVALIAAVFVVIQLFLLQRDSRITSKAALTTAYDSISQGSDRLTSTFIDKPRLYRMFWDDLEATTPDEQAQTSAIAEMHLDFIDSVVEQERDLSGHMDWSTWDVYFRSIYRDSSCVRSFIDANFDYYPDYVYARLGLVVVREDRNTGARKQIWRAYDCRPTVSGSDEPGAESPASRAAALIGRSLPRPGFPWITTWLFEKVGTDGEPESPAGGVSADTVVVSVSGVRPHRDRLGTRTLLVADFDVAWNTMPDGPDLLALQGWVAETMRSSEIRRVQFTYAGGVTPRRIAIRPPAAGAPLGHNYIHREPKPARVK